jgi:hypothetical protein
MKAKEVKFLTLVAFFVLGLTACRDKKVVEAVNEWVKKTIVFSDIEPIILYSSGDTLKYAVPCDGHTRQ